MAISARLRSANVLRRWVLLALTVLVLAVGIQYTIKAAGNRSAFVRWRSQLVDLGRGKDIYQLYLYPNAPMMALMLYPIARLPETSIGQFELDFGALSWFALKVGMAVLAFIWTVRLIEQKHRPFPAWAQAATLALSVRPIIGDLTHGNVNLLILFLVVASLYAFKRGRDLTAGLVLALAITCKVTPALFLPYFLWKRAWKTAIGSGLGLVLFFLVIPGIFLGPERNWALLHSWSDKMIEPYVLKGEVTTEHNNQSLPGLIYRLGTPNPSFYHSDTNEPTAYHNVITLDPATARYVVKGFGVAFLVLLLWCCRTPGRPRDNWKLAAEYSIIVLGMLLFSERTWKHHCVTLLLPFGVVCYYLAAYRPRGLGRYGLIACIAAAVLFMASSSTSLWEAFGPRMGAKIAQVYGAYVWAYLALLAALVGLLLNRKPLTQVAQRLL